MGITEAMSMAPTPVIEVLLGRPPLHLQLEVEAKAGVYRLNCNYQRKPKSEGSGHADMTWNMKKEPILQLGKDKNDTEICLLQVIHSQVSIYM
jgi:hypothetical protein